MSDVFISYSRSDKEKVADLVGRLKGRGLDVWWDDDGIQSGRDWTADLETRIRNASSVVVVWSRGSIGSLMVRAEAVLAFDLKKARPVRIENVSPPLPFNILHAVDLLPPDEWTRVDGLVEDIREGRPVVMIDAGGRQTAKPASTSSLSAAMLITPVFMLAGFGTTMAGALLASAYAPVLMVMGGVLSAGGLGYAFMSLMQSRR